MLLKRLHVIKMSHVTSFSCSSPDQLKQANSYTEYKMTEARPIIYLIRHGEKGAKLPDGKDPDGLDAQGLIRANGLPQVFGSSSEYNISYILAEHPKSGRSS